MAEEKKYIAIDLKSFYASVECVERGLDPLRARLVVADASRTEKTICLAVSPELKNLGISGRARLYEVYAKTRDFIIASPRMQKYMEVSQQIFRIYAEFVATEDIHVYSIDEVFIDATSYLKNYDITAHELAQRMIQAVLKQTGITATAGIGTNLYLAKVAMDIEAKHQPADENGVRIAELDERSYREKLWSHTSLKDFWRIGPGYARRLADLGIYTMGDLARYSLTGYENLYREFGINAELLIDHAWGYEPVSMQDVKSYRARNHCLSSGQVLAEPYDYGRARTVVAEMADDLALQLVRQGLCTDQVILTVGYDISNMRFYTGEVATDFYGRKIPKHARGTVNFDGFLSASSIMTERILEVFERVVDKKLTVRRIYLVANNIRLDDGEFVPKQLDIFTDYHKLQNQKTREKRKMKAILKIKDRYGKNAILTGTNFEEGATQIKRNGQVGGHRA